MTPEERAAKLAREICACTCHGTKPAPADNSGPLKDGSHYANCPAEDEAGAAADIAAAIRDALADDREAIMRKCEELKTRGARSNRERGYNDACDDIAAAIRARTP